MDDTEAPPRRNDADDPEAGSAELRMRLALERLGTRASPAQHGPGSRAGGAAAAVHIGPRARKRFVRDGEVPVERVPASARPAADTGFEVAEERAARQRAEQALADAQGSISRLQMALSRAEQAARTAREGVEEREREMDRLRSELAASAGRREAALAAAARAEADLRLAQERERRPPAREPEPVRWWLQPTKPGG